MAETEALIDLSEDSDPKAGGREADLGHGSLHSCHQQAQQSSGVSKGPGKSITENL